MIVLLGATRDDILYYETVLKNKINCLPEFEKFPVVQGTIFNQNVTICYGATTSYLTGALTEALIRDYNPMVVLQLGKCKSLTDDWKNGDIAISNEYYAMDVDQCEYKNVKLAQIPEMEIRYQTHIDVLHIMNASFDKFVIGNVFNATYLSSNAVPRSMDDVSSLYQNGLIFGVNSRVVVDTDAYASLLPCVLHKIPFIAIKAVDSKVSETSGVTNFVKTLDTYSKIGRAVVSFIGEIGRRDLKED